MAGVNSSALQVSLGFKGHYLYKIQNVSFTLLIMVILITYRNDTIFDLLGETRLLKLVSPIFTFFGVASRSFEVTPVVCMCGLRGISVWLRCSKGRWAAWVQTPAVLGL